MRLSRPAALFFWGLCWFGVIGCLLVSLVAFAGVWHWFFDLFSHLRPIYFVCLAVAAAVALAGRRWFLLAASVCGLIANGIALAPHARASLLHEVPPAAAPVLRLVTLNLHRYNFHHDAVVNLLRDRGPDVVLLQEVSRHWVEALGGISDLYPHQKFDDNTRRTFGLGVLSRNGWTKAEVLQMGGQSDRLGLAVQLDLSGRPVVILNIHGYHPTSREKVRLLKSYQDSAAGWVTEQARWGNPAVVTGDFNYTPWSVHYRRFMELSGLLDTSQGRIFEATRNVWFPDRILIDHAFVSDHWRLLRREVGPDVGSDHRPVFVDLALIR